MMPKYKTALMIVTHSFQGINLRLQSVANKTVSNYSWSIRDNTLQYNTINIIDQAGDSKSK